MDSYNTRTDKSAPVWNLKDVRLLTTSLASVQTAPSHKPQAFFVSSFNMAADGFPTAL